jgi:uncharacterized tellurite resistance protein B-like protein
MFNFFNKKRDIDFIKKHLSGFEGTFTDEQKKAILVSLYVIANADDEFHEMEEEFFKKTAGLLNYNLSDNINEEFSSISRAEVFKLLKGFSDSQKDWYLVTVAGMIHADGKVLANELDDAFRYLLSMGISKKRMDNTIEKLNSIIDK